MLDLYEKIINIFVTAAMIGYLVFICGVVTGFFLVFFVGVPIEAITFLHISGFSIMVSFLIGLCLLVIRLKNR